jgi:molybdopterin molybdotransferase
MISAQEAEVIILDLITAIKDTETVNLKQATSRILAQNISSKLDFPYWDNSAMDGYAVRYEDAQTVTTNLVIIEEIATGKIPNKIIEKGQAARIFTGAMLPKGADTIIIQENTERQGDFVQIRQAPQQRGEYVRYRGEYYQAGKTLLTPGIRLQAPEIAILATAQVTSLEVVRRPRVALFSTGDELISPEQTLQTGQIVDSNQYALAAFVETQGAIPLPLGIVGDRLELLETAIAQAVNTADLVLSTGGVSVGEYDYVEEILGKLGAEILITSVAIKPGKPLTVAKFPNGCVYFGIPGNPVSALVICWRFVCGALQKLSGCSGDFLGKFLDARTLDNLKGAKAKETYLWGKVNFTSSGLEFRLASGSQSSANLINLAQTNALAVVPQGIERIEAGENVKIILL